MPLPPKKLTSDELITDILMKDVERSMGNRAELVVKDLKPLRKCAKKFKMAIQKTVTHKKVELSKNRLIEGIMRFSPVAVPGLLGGCLELVRKNLKPLQNIVVQMKIETSNAITHRVKAGWMWKGKG